MTTKVRFTLTISILISLLVGGLSSFVFIRVRSEMLLQASQSLETYLKHEAEHLLQPMESQELNIDKNHFGDILLKITSDDTVLFDSFTKKSALVSAPDYIVKESVQTLNGKSIKLTGAYNLLPIYSYLDSLRKTLFLGWLFTLALVVPISYSLTLALLRPFRKLSEKTSELNIESLSFRFPMTKYQDEEGRLIVSFNALLERLERSFDHMKKFAMNVSHEIRTPISVIMSQSDIALRKDRTSEEYRSALEVSLNETKRLKNIIDNLLSLAEIDRIHDENRKTTFLIKNKIDEIVKSLSIRWGSDKKIEIDCDVSLTYTGNEVAFTSIVANLIENGLKYGKSRVKISCMEQGERFVFLVEDDGPGVEMKSSVPVGQTSHGLGLSIVRAFSEAYGGDISFRSSSLGGLCVATSLPTRGR